MNLLNMTVPLFNGNCAMAFNQDLSGRDTSKVKLILILSGTLSISSGALGTNERGSIIGTQGWIIWRNESAVTYVTHALVGAIACRGGLKTEIV